MTPRELRREMRQRREELRRSLALMRQQARERVRQLPAVRRERNRRRVRRAVGLALLLLLACLTRCECQQAPPPAKAVVQEKPEVKPKTPAPAPPRREPLRAQVKPLPRGSYQGETQAPPTWLEDFRLQVAARSPRLAQCFTGTDRPGVLRWTASVNPESGAVADHELEPLGPGAELKREQRDCVVRALSSPTYRLSSQQAQVLPNRISLVIEF
ncbi:hypothetical protein F0U60_10220 [Archangium minus]|uniref:TonB C-terminal domain-containing protein n=1 Tax=Archangium minus TaxID=83450 RepID=A0ABY9WNP7_9BACT|nr:hypothetical protein F0U60_10220 [Archangium minus]